MKTKIIFSALAILTAGTVLWASASKVSAQSTNQYSIIQRIAAKFGLKEADVKTVFESEREERQKEMQQRFENRLTQAVQDKKITESQKAAILKKHQEMQTEREQNRTEWLNWLKSNNLENVDLGFGFGGGLGKGMGRGMHNF